MSATVVDLSSRRRHRVPTDGCAGCQARGDGDLCYPHRLASVAGQLNALMRNTDGELLVDRDLLVRVVSPAVEVLDGIFTECLPDEERPAR